MIKRLLAFLVLCPPAQAQISHSVTLDYTGAYFWDSEKSGPLRFRNLHHWFYPPGTINYYALGDKWGINIGFDSYQTYYSGSEFTIPIGASHSYALYARQYTAGHINLLRDLAGNSRGAIFASAGYVHYFASSTSLAFRPDPTEILIALTHKDWNNPGINLGLVARYRIWKGFTFQATATHTKLFGAKDFSNISNLRLGYGYTFGGGINRSQKRQPAP